MLLFAGCVCAWRKFFLVLFFFLCFDKELVGFSSVRHFHLLTKLMLFSSENGTFFVLVGGRCYLYSVLFYFCFLWREWTMVQRMCICIHNTRIQRFSAIPQRKTRLLLIYINIYECTSTDNIVACSIIVFAIDLECNNILDTLLCALQLCCMFEFNAFMTHVIKGELWYTGNQLFIDTHLFCGINFPFNYKLVPVRQWLIMKSMTTKKNTELDSIFPISATTVWPWPSSTESEATNIATCIENIYLVYV